MKIISTKMTFRCVELDKMFAQDLLNKNHPNNRKPKPSRIQLYRTEMNNGFWELTWEPIVQDEDGYTVEGQNRLAAFIQSDLDVLPVVLCTGVPRKAIQGAGTAMARTIADAARIAGVPFPHGEAQYGAVAKRMMLGMENYYCAVSPKSVLAFVARHRRAIEFAFAVFPVKNVRGITQAPVMAVVARAYYRRGMKDRLLEFGQILMDGLPKNRNEDAAAIRLRNFLLDNIAGGRRRGTGMRPKPKIVYAKTELALNYFLDFEPVDILRETSVEMFPIPDDPALWEDSAMQAS